MREAAEKLIECAQDTGDWEAIARACLAYMSEAEVADMANCEGFIEEDEQDD